MIGQIIDIQLIQSSLKTQINNPNINTINSNSNASLINNKKQQYLCKQYLGSGGFAKCYLLVNKKNNLKIAAKVINKAQMKSKSSRNKVLQQIDIHKSLNHKNIVKFYSIIQHNQNTILLIQYCQNYSLKQMLKSRSRITEFQARYFLHQIIQGIQYLHQKNIIHRDIKLGNIFINHQMQLKIGDFGLSTCLKSTKDKKYTLCGTPNYIAPQILNQTGHSFQVDIWACGIILYAFLYGKPPFQSGSVDQTYKKIKNHQYQFPKNIPVSQSAKNLIKCLLEPNPKKRISLQKIKLHQFMNKDKFKIPQMLPAYTISLPPQNSFLKQYQSVQISTKLTILPKRLSLSSKPTQFKSTEDIKQIQTKRQHKQSFEKGKQFKTNRKMTRQNQQKSSIHHYSSYKQIKDMFKLNRVVSLDKNLLSYNKIETQGKTQKSNSKLNLAFVNQNSTSSFNEFTDNLQFRSLQKQQKCNPSDRNLIESIRSPRRYEDDCSQVICYYDMSTKYGIGYILSNGNLGVVFNDGTSLTQLINNAFIYYQNHSIMKLKSPQGSLKKKGQILKLCKQKLQSYKKNNVLIPYYSQSYVQKWLSHHEYFVLKLNNGIMQFFDDCNSLTLKGYKWIKWRLQNQQGQCSINTKHSNILIQQKINDVKQFLKTYSQKGKTRKSIQTNKNIQ